MLTREEQAAVTCYLKTKTRGWRYWLDYLVYLLPTLILAVYGLAKRDFVAGLVAYACLLLFVVWYLIYARGASKPLYSALEKYEALRQAHREEQTRRYPE